MGREWKEGEEMKVVILEEMNEWRGWIEIEDDGLRLSSEDIDQSKKASTEMLSEPKIDWKSRSSDSKRAGSNPRARITSKRCWPFRERVLTLGSMQRVSALRERMLKW